MSDKVKRILPAWVMDEVEAPTTEGGRNDQAIRIGPTLLRHGYNEAELLTLFEELYPGLTGRELRTLVRQSKFYASGKRGSGGPGLDHSRLDAITRDARERLQPKIFKTYPYRSFTHLRGERSSSVSLCHDRRMFLNTMFKPSDVIWIGDKTSCGERAFNTVNDWLARDFILGEFVSHSTFRPGSTSRSNANVLERRYLVVESDTLSLQQVDSIFQYLQRERGLKLRAVVSSGGRSWHGWFDMPSKDKMILAEWAALLTGLGCDSSTLRPSQPVRLPGCIRRDTQRQQQLLYLGT